ncbi:dihydrolipoyl dehydrogenase [Propionigenium maris DSM 9537]|uniref:Dihydrolipoyl dehydrogenase n=1 Tax=Propionigenium maris DSM 9537 TaxID=1123000 RepID=A0A9W6GP33_9FUSO|nr:dihydrolipoyl dehydrogenase [Propionigenium maris]GLI57419.1 dihydrolipoyl dehydrogenase [Propionigenium maris DSM 9537]
MNYDIIVLGSGPGGYVAAIKAAQLGGKVAIVEKDNFGGVCLNWGCIPTKTLLKNAKVYQYILNSSKYGVDIPDLSAVTLNWENMLSRKEKVVEKLTSGVEYLLKKNGVDIYRGFGTVIDKNSVEVEGEVIKCENLILSTGSTPRIPEIPGIKEGLASNFVVTSREALELPSIPKELVILGGGVIGVEFATLYSSLGTRVTIVQNIDKILEFMDHDVVAEMEEILKKSDVEILYNSSIIKVDGKEITVKGKEGRRTLTPDHLLVSIGRYANLKGLENLSLKTYRRGVVTNNKMETNVPGVYAIGDLNGVFNLAHVASAEGIVAVENILKKKDMTINYNKVPNCIYSSPEMAAAGYNEADARKKFTKVIVSKFPLSANGKALAEGENTGFIKIIAEGEYGEIVGVHIIAPTATDMISEIVTTMELEGTIHDLAKVIHPHPSLSEIVMEAAHGAVHKPIHM